MLIHELGPPSQGCHYHVLWVMTFVGTPPESNVTSRGYVKDPQDIPATFIDLFAGCGGFSLGLMQAGWEGILAVEKDAFAFQTLQDNLIEGTHGYGYSWPDWFPQEPCTIERFTEAYGHELARLRGHITLIAGGPPCQGFSLAGRRKHNDPRNSLFRHYLKVVQITRAPVLLLENVRGISIEFGKKKRLQRKSRGRPATPFSKKIADELEASGYAVYTRLVRASEFGVPQLRPRYFLLAIERALVPDPVTFDPFAALEAIRRQFLAERRLPVDRPVSVREALSDLETAGKPLVECVDSPGFKQIAYGHPVSNYQTLLHGSMNGTPPNSLRLANHRPEIVERFRRILETCRRGVQLNRADRERLKLKKHCTVPLDPGRPSHTLTTLPDDLLHYSEPRILSVREYARLQSFPDWYAFRGKYTTGGHLRVRQCPRYTQVGNAVPPFLGECLARLIRTLYDGLVVRSPANRRRPTSARP